MAGKTKSMDCVKCGSKAKPAKTTFQGMSISGWKCAKCGEIYYDPAQAQRILVLHKLEHEELKAKLGRVKSNLILRIPKAVEECLGLKEGEKIRLKVRNSTEVTLTTG
ncbi:MAG: hypothetical protein WC408_00525 [Candidatus Micrarchaeia archaeon]